jgi:hypothetical protein
MPNYKSLQKKYIKHVLNVKSKKKKKQMCTAMKINKTREKKQNHDIPKI